MTAILSNSLTELADRIRAASDAVIAAERTTAEKVIEAGWLLVQAKAQCAHGEWLPFLDRAGVHDRAARKWMQIADSGLEIGPVADLGIRGTLQFLSRWRMPEDRMALRITVDEDLPGEDVAERGVAYIFREPSTPEGHVHIWTLNATPAHGGDGECAATRRPMLPRIEVGEGHRPVDTIVHWLTCSGFGLPISNWRLETVEHRGDILSEAYNLCAFWPSDRPLQEPA